MLIWQFLHLARLSLFVINEVFTQKKNGPLSQPQTVNWSEATQRKYFITLNSIANIHISSVKILCLTRKRTIFWVPAEVPCLVFPWLSVGTPLACDKETRTNLLEDSEKLTTLKSHTALIFPWPFKHPLPQKSFCPQPEKYLFFFKYHQSSY